MELTFTRDDLQFGKYCEFIHYGFRIGKIIKRKGAMLTVVTAPYKLRGEHTGQKVRVHADKVLGIVHRKKVVTFNE